MYWKFINYFVCQTKFKCYKRTKIQFVEPPQKKLKPLHLLDFCNEMFDK